MNAITELVDGVAGGHAYPGSDDHEKSMSQKSGKGFENGNGGGGVSALSICHVISAPLHMHIAPCLCVCHSGTLQEQPEVL